ncbi:MAG TPA: hypothetical protein VNA69_15145 [Thermoanaerobaculia bacterium]|nr:hypothetical protein [Thermoanaerobaculia bacterium]
MAVVQLCGAADANPRELEHELVSALVTEDICAEASRAVSGALDDATRARTEEAYVRRLVREKHDLPQLTLFR